MSQAIPRGGPAFPSSNVVISCGMTLRDYFATHASEDDVGYYAQEHMRTTGMKSSTPAIARYLYADAMLKEREKSS